MKKIHLFFLMLFSLTAFSQNQNPISDKRLDGFDKNFNQLLKDWKAVGFSVAVVEKGEIIYSKGFGYRDLEKKLPADGNTLFAIGSCSKAFSAALIGQLVNEGKLDLDKPINSYFPKLRFYNDQMNSMITLRDMMSHKTGLPRHDASWYYFPSRSKDSLLQRIQYMEPSATVREKWQYNNFMYCALGAIDEQISGVTWDNNIRNKIFAPLSMARSTTNLKDWVADPNASLGYFVDKDSTIKKMDYFDISGMSPAGAINSSVNEMAHWVMAWLNDGKFNGKEVIPVSYRTQAISSQAIITGGLPKDKLDIQFSNYGFGWMLSSYKEHYRVEHGGNINGFSASTTFFPTDSIGIIVLVNQNNSYVPGLVRNLIADKLLGKKFFDWNADMKKTLPKSNANPDKEKDSTKNTGKPTTHDLKDYAGDYTNPGYGTMKIYFENNKLFFKSNALKMELRHKTFDIFKLIAYDASGNEIPEEDPAVGTFLLNENGDIDNFSSRMDQGIQPIVFKKEIKEMAISTDELQTFVGDYDMMGTTVKFFLKNNKTLYALVPGQPEYELIPTDKNKFALKILSGYSVQFNTKENTVDFIQPNGTFSAKKK